VLVERSIVSVVHLNGKGLVHCELQFDLPVRSSIGRLCHTLGHSRIPHAGSFVGRVANGPDPAGTVVVGAASPAKFCAAPASSPGARHVVTPITFLDACSAPRTLLCVSFHPIHQLGLFRVAHVKFVLGTRLVLVPGDPVSEACAMRTSVTLHDRIGICTSEGRAGREF
jgi:hypothetical protein